VRGALSLVGATAASLYAAAFAVAYWLYAQAGGAFLSDLWLNLVALPYTLTVRAVVGSSDFAADSVGQDLAAAGFCCVLAYVGGALIEALLRGAWRLARRRPRNAA
jgi:Zn-dependent protease with chaperone function